MADREQGQFGLLRARRFGPFFVTQTLGAFNDNVFKNALVILVTFGIAGLSPADVNLYVNLAAGLFILPFFLFSATAGQIAEKYEKSRLIRGIKLFEIVIMLLAVAGLALGSIPFLMGVLFLMGTQSALFGPVKY
jgi:MFS family permease